LGATTGILIILVCFGPCVVVNNRWYQVHLELEFPPQFSSADKLWITHVLEKVHRVESRFCGLVPQMSWVVSGVISVVTVGIGKLNEMLAETDPTT